MSKTTPTATLTLYRLASLFALLAVVMGALVCATNSGTSCPTWPGCRPDQVAPQLQLRPVIEFTHRLVVMTLGPLLLAAAIAGVRARAVHRLGRALPWVAVGGALLAGAFGRLAVLGRLTPPLAAIDLLAALITMTTMAVAAVLATAAPAGPRMARLPQRHLRISQLAGAGSVVLIALFVTGILAAGKGSYTRCLGWPMWRLVSGDHQPWLQYLRLGLATAGALLIVATGVEAARTVRLRRQGTVLVGLFAAEILTALVIRADGLNSAIAAAHSVLAAALLWTMALLAARAGTPDPQPRPDSPIRSDDLDRATPVTAFAGGASRR